MKPRSPEETDRILRRQVWHYRRDWRTDWNTDGCEWERVLHKGSHSREEE